MTEIRDFDKFTPEGQIKLLHSRSVEHAKRLIQLEQTNNKVVTSLNRIVWMLGGGLVMLVGEATGLIKLIISAF